jgi:DivIVA domain-containing protein
MADDRRYNAADVPVTAEEVAHRGFSTAFRGFDANEVRAYLNRVAESLRAARDRQRELELLLRETEARAAKPVLDEATLTSALGEHTARIIRSAHEAAADIRLKAEESVEKILKDAHEDATRIRADAERVLADRSSEAEAECNALRQAAEADAQGMRRRSQEQADRMLERSRVQAKEIANESQALRARVLGDLMRRRRSAVMQVEQLQAGRDRLLEAYRVVRRTLDEATESLERAEADARAAAEAAAHRVAAEPEPTPAELLGEIAPHRELSAESDQIPPDSVDSSAPEPPVAVPAEPVAPMPAMRSSVRVLRGVPDAPAEEPPGPDEVQESPRPSLAVVQPPSEIESVRIVRADDPMPEPAPTPEPVVMAEPEPEPEPEPEAEPEVRPEVDELFAKLRDEVAEEPAADEQADEQPVAVADEPDEEALLRTRDEVLTPINAALTRKLKRALQDEQNEVLDRLRRHRGGKPSIDVAFPEGVDHASRYADVVHPLLADALAAGASSAGAAPPKEADEAVAAIAAELADALLAPLRRKLDNALADAASIGEDEAGVTSRVSAAYRDWKTARLERLSADHAGSAYAAGAFGTWAPGTPLKWIVRDVDGECPDCDDNALAGPTPRGEAFPTGQVRPPAHAGCRCLLAPASA